MRRSRSGRPRVSSMWPVAGTTVRGRCGARLATRSVEHVNDAIGHEADVTGPSRRESDTGSGPLARANAACGGRAVALGPSAPRSRSQAPRRCADRVSTWTNGASSSGGRIGRSRGTRLGRGSDGQSCHGFRVLRRLGLHQGQAGEFEHRLQLIDRQRRRLRHGQRDGLRHRDHPRRAERREAGDSDRTRRHDDGRRSGDDRCRGTNAGAGATTTGAGDTGAAAVSVTIASSASTSADSVRLPRDPHRRLPRHGGPGFLAAAGSTATATTATATTLFLRDFGTRIRRHERCHRNRRGGHIHGRGDGCNRVDVDRGRSGLLALLLRAALAAWPAALGGVAGCPRFLRATFGATSAVVLLRLAATRLVALAVTAFFALVVAAFAPFLVATAIASTVALVAAAAPLATALFGRPVARGAWRRRPAQRRAPAAARR